MAAEQTTTTPNKISVGYVASEIWSALQGFEILQEYVAGGGPVDHQNWLAETSINLLREALAHAEALDDAERKPEVALDSANTFRGPEQPARGGRTVARVAG